jgi:inhibitor of cysteine peptidase
VQQISKIKNGGVPVKLRLLSLFVLLIPAFWLAACAPLTGGTPVVVSCDVFNQQPHQTKQVSVTAGDSFSVTLCSNATTGYQWSDTAQISDLTVIEQLSHETLAPQNTKIVGAPGSEMWTFKALKKGTTTIHMDYSRPWEGGEKGTWTFDLTVTVN